MRRLPSSLGVLLACATLTVTAAAGPIVDVTVTGPRVHLGDLLVGLGPEVADVDVGPTPSGNGTRLIAREEIAAALHEHGIDGSTTLPQAVRVHRKLKKLEPQAVGELVTRGLDGKLPRGVSLQSVNFPHATMVPDGWTDVRCDLARPARRVGPLAATVSLAFFDGDQALWTLSVPVDLVLSQEATLFDVPRGSRVTLVIRRGLVEVSSSGTVTTDVDVGGVAPVIVMPSGRSIPARFETDHLAVMVETP